jgi:Mannose-6-phosphate isomerase
MIDINKYMESGAIEEYYLGILNDDGINQLMELREKYPEVKAYMEEIAKTNTMFFTSIQKEPPLSCLLTVQTAIKNSKLWLETQLNSKTKLLPDFINISRHTSVEKVEAVIKQLKPTENYDNIFLLPLYTDEKRELVIVWVKDFVPLEEHSDLDESFLILEGTVDCYIDDEVFHMIEGDFMRIPPGSKHKVVITSKIPAKAVQSRIAI